MKPSLILIGPQDLKPGNMSFETEVQPGPCSIISRDLLLKASLGFVNGIRAGCFQD